jgi:UDP-N-acetylglucosamine diphosphorylase/glucosamine-1-phosphate N-acetyltransferase
MNVILFDDPAIRTHLLPFTFTRPVAAIRTGILTIAEKWQRRLKTSVSFATADYLQEKFPLAITSDNLWINGALCPDEILQREIEKLKPDEGLSQNNIVIAYRHPDKKSGFSSGKWNPYPHPLVMVDKPWRIFQFNGEQIRKDFLEITAGRKSEKIEDPHTRVYQSDQIFLEPGVSIKAAILNAERGPIYLGKNSMVQEGTSIRGPFALGEGSIVNMGAKMRGDISIGPYSKVGGEVSATVIFGHSNKAHDGFLGCSVLGEWCNLGADTNTSNLKNNYDTIKLWNYASSGFEDTGLQFCGLMMGDHSKSGINSMFNTGTVVGVSSNVYGPGFPRNFIPSFAWGGSAGWKTFQIDKALETAQRAMERRSTVLDTIDRNILQEVFNQESSHRVWDQKR